MMHQDELIDQPTARTGRKVKVAAWAASASTLVAGLVVKYAMPDLDDPLYTAAIISVITPGVTGLATWAAGYYARERRENVVIE